MIIKRLYPYNIFKIFIFILINLLHLDNKAQDVDRIIDQYFNTINHKEICNISSITIKGTRASVGERDFIEIIQRPDKYRCDYDMGPDKFSLIYDGETGWQINPFSLGNKIEYLIEHAIDLVQIKENADIDGILFNWREKGHKVTLCNDKDTMYNEFYKLKIITRDHDTLYYFLNSNNYYLTKKTYIFKNGEQTIKTHLFFSDHRKVNGMIFPFKIETFQYNNLISTISINKIIFNIEYDNHFFKSNTQENGIH